MRNWAPVALALLGFEFAAFGLATEQIGPDRDHPTVAQPDWPKGIVGLPRHASRVYSIWVNGNENFYFKADLRQINELLALFARARQRDHEVWIRTGKKQVQSFGKEVIDYNVNLRVLGGIALSMAARGQGDGGTEPQLTVYVDDARMAEQLVLADNLILHCEIEGTRLKTAAVKPTRTPCYGRIEFEGAESAAGSPPGTVTQISLWEAGLDECIKLARLGANGLFEVAMSEQETAALRRGGSWLTVTIGNWLTEPKPADPTFPAEWLGDKAGAKVLRIPGPKFYHGRLLFEDGSAPILKPEPWPGARIHVDFPYAGSVEPDQAGYFKVFFTKEQFDKVASDPPRKNVYVPDPSERGRATARFTFPASLLSQDKAQAGLLKIPRPPAPGPQ
jgi:hypothetical protein